MRRKSAEGVRDMRDWKNSLKLRPWDLFILTFFVLLSFLPTILFRQFAGGTTGQKMVSIVKDGVEIFRTELRDDRTETLSFPFVHDGKSYTGFLEMKDGAVRLHRLPEDIVPLGIHEDMGWIREPFEIIVALPIKLYVSVESEAPSDVDIMVQ